jgi:hypothetical protein
MATSAPAKMKSPACGSARRGSTTKTSTALAETPTASGAANVHSGDHGRPGEPTRATTTGGSGMRGNPGSAFIVPRQGTVDEGLWQPANPMRPGEAQNWK